MSRASVLALVALGAAAVASPTLAQDRYGPSAAADPGAYRGASEPGVPAPSAASTALRGRMLSWPGKRDEAAMAPAYAPPATARAYAPPQAYAAPRAYGQPYASRAYPGSAPARQPYTALRAYAQQAPAPPTQAYPPYNAAAAYPSQSRAAPPRYPGRPSADAPAQDGWRPVFGDASASPRASVQDMPAPPTLSGAPNRSDLPASIYTPASTSEMTPAQRAAAAPPPLRTASAAQRYGYDPSQGHQVRFYSVHRPFGLQPDAAPIPPQFFTASADLSQPAGPLPTDRTTTTTASGTRISHVAPDTSPN